MQFDFCISNPAFNVAEGNNVAGTGGNTTLYKTATRNDFVNRVKPGGTLINVTLKGIIPDLIDGFFKDYQVDFIHLMDDIDVWPYNTCFFSVTKKPRISPPVILGGMAAKIYQTNPANSFPFVYYSGANNGMNKKFGHNKANRVIRQLPGRGRDSVSYEYTDEDIPAGPKFAFYVMESKKSYTVTDEPVYGGTICYIPFATMAEAEKMKLFVENNPTFALYVKRMKLRGHAFGLRYVKKFDINQIVTGLETPVEWLLNSNDLSDPLVLPNDITEDRNRVKALGEVFTPTALVEQVLDTAQTFHPTMFNSTNTFIDSMCGDGQFLLAIKNRGIPLSNIYGIELEQDNVDVCIARLQSNDAQIKCADSLGNTFTIKQKLDFFIET